MRDIMLYNKYSFIIDFYNAYVTGNVRNQAIRGMPRQCRESAHCLSPSGNPRNAQAMWGIRTLPESFQAMCGILNKQFMGLNFK